MNWPYVKRAPEVDGFICPEMAGLFVSPDTCTAANGCATRFACCGMAFF
jgi:hypothetical protein